MSGNCCRSMVQRSPMTTASRSSPMARSTMRRRWAASSCAPTSSPSATTRASCAAGCTKNAAGVSLGALDTGSFCWRVLGFSMVAAPRCTGKWWKRFASASQNRGGANPV